jgi:hypothetical protein
MKIIICIDQVSVKHTLTTENIALAQIHSHMCQNNLRFNYYNYTSNISMHDAEQNPMTDVTYHLS